MLKLCDVSMYYQNGTNVTVGIQKINLEMKTGEFVVITGESGSGKSTLLNVISAIAPYHDGEMLLDGQPTSGFDDADWEVYRREHIGFIFQNYSLIESYTVLQNVVSSMLIMGVEPDEAKKRAYSYLERVGLSELAGRRASKLSAGQKQRLTIARALAKETDIIIADEPTGNLDSKNGRQIVELLASLSADRLVVMVSHNIEEAEEFATRMIRMKDGRIVSDTVLRSAAPQAGAAEAREKKPAEAYERKDEKTRRHSDMRLARRLAGCNSRFQPAKAALMTVLMAAVCIAAFIFLGSMLSNIDDTPAKVYDTTAFLNGDNTRIIVQHNDGSPITEEDLSWFESLPNVSFVDEYAYAGDCCYYYMDGYDYRLRYVEYQQGGDGPFIREIHPQLLRNINFIKSAKRLSPDALAAGHLPENSNEVVLYGGEERLGEKITMYFSDTVGWAKSECIRLEMTVSGVLKEETSSVYFHENISKAFQLSRSLDRNVMKTSFVGAYEELFDYSKADPAKGILPSTFIDVSVRDYDARLFPDATLADGTLLSTYEVDSTAFGRTICSGHFTMAKNADGTYEETADKAYGFARQFTGLLGIMVTLDASGGYTFWDLAETKCDFENDVGYIELPPEESFMLFQNVETGLGDDYDGHFSGSFTVIDEKSFNKYMDYFNVSSDQAAIYVTNYAYVDDTLAALAKSGEYMGVSPFKIGSTVYDKTKVRERFTALILSLVALIAVFALEVTVLFTLMRLKRDDYAIFKSLGMTSKVMHRMNFIELMRYALTGLAAAAVIVGALWIFDVPPLDGFTVYYRWQHVAVIAVCSLAAAVLLSAVFNRYLDGQFNGKRITGENGR